MPENAPNILQNVFKKYSNFWRELDAELPDGDEWRIVDGLAERLGIAGPLRLDIEFVLSIPERIQPELGESTLMLQKSQKFGWQGGPKTGAGIVLEYVSEPVAGPTTPRRACAI